MCITHIRRIFQLLRAPIPHRGWLQEVEQPI